MLICIYLILFAANINIINIQIMRMRIKFKATINLRRRWKINGYRKIL